MRKYIFIIMLITIMGTVLFGCKNNKSPQLNDTGKPESYFEYGFMEECTDGTKYIKVESFEVSTEYKTNQNTTEDSGYYYVILGVDTNLSEADFSDKGNLSEIMISSNQLEKLSFVLWDADNGKLVYKIEKKDSLDYLQLQKLKISESDGEFPFLFLLFDLFDKYCVVDDGQYCGKCIVLNLEK